MRTSAPSPTASGWGSPRRPHEQRGWSTSRGPRHGRSRRRAASGRQKARATSGLGFVWHGRHAGRRLATPTRHAPRRGEVAPARRAPPSAPREGPRRPAPGPATEEGRSAAVSAAATQAAQRIGSGASSAWPPRRSGARRAPSRRPRRQADAAPRMHAPRPSRGASQDAARRAGTAAAPSRPHALGRRVVYRPCLSPSRGAPVQPACVAAAAGGARSPRAGPPFFVRAPLGEPWCVQLRVAARGGARPAGSGTLGTAPQHAVPASATCRPAPRAAAARGSRGAPPPASAPRVHAARRCRRCCPGLQGLGLHLASGAAAAPAPHCARRCGRRPPRHVATAQQLTRAPPRAPPLRLAAAEGEGQGGRAGARRGQEACGGGCRQVEQPAAGGEAAEELRCAPRAANAGPPRCSPDLQPRRDRWRAAAQDAAEPLREVAEVRPHPASASRAHQAPQGAAAASKTSLAIAAPSPSLATQVPPAINQFTKVLDKNLGAPRILLRMLLGTALGRC